MMMMANIQRQRQTQLQNGQLINADDLNTELDQLVNKANQLDDTLFQNATLTGEKQFTQAIVAQAGGTLNGTLGGSPTLNATFTMGPLASISGTVKVNTLAETTLGNGIVQEGVRTRRGLLKVAVATTPVNASTTTNGVTTTTYAPEEGELWYQTDCRTLFARTATATRVLVPASAEYVGGPPPGAMAANTLVLPAGTEALSDDGKALLRLESSVTLDVRNSGLLGLDTGTKAANTWYHVWLIGGPTVATTAVFSASSSAPSLGGAYTLKRRLPFPLRMDAASNFVLQAVVGGWPLRPQINYQTLYNPVLNASTSAFTKAGLTATTYTALDFTDAIPPTSNLGLFFGYSRNASASLISMRTDAATNNPNDVVSSYGNWVVEVGLIPTTASRTVEYRVGNAGEQVNVGCKGYVVTQM
jgi:hypothetical protein